MLGKIDWVNAVQNITIGGTRGISYTSPVDGYIWLRSIGNGVGTTKPITINGIAIKDNSSAISTYTSVASFGNLIPVSKNDVITVSQGSSFVANTECTITFFPQKGN